MTRIQDRYRLLRIKTALTDDGPWSGLTQPSSGDVVSVSWTPATRVFVFLVPLDASDDPVADDNAGTCTLAGIKIADLDADDTVDATDLAVRTAALTSVPYYTEVEVPCGGALRYTVELSSLANNATGQTQVAVYVRESEA